MRREGMDRGVILIAAIVVILAGMVVFTVLSLRTDEVSDRVAANEQLTTLLAIELPNGTLTAQVFAFQPRTGRGALFDIPADTGVVVPALNRVDAIQEAFHSGSIDAYRDSVAELIGQPLDYYLLMDAEGFEDMTDLLGGLPLFVTGIPTEGPAAVRIPSGDVRLDGAKALQYLAYESDGETLRETVARRQKIVTGMLVTIGEEASLFVDSAGSRLALELLETDLERSAFGSYALALGELASDRMISRQVEGLYRRVSGGAEEQILLFPHQEGRWLRESVRQVVENINSDESIRDENIVIRLEILNGTEISGLASRTAELYRSYGFDVIAVGNAQSNDIESTSVVDRVGNEVFANRTADIIRAAGTETRIDDQAVVDVTIVLGRDFDGRFVR